MCSLNSDKHPASAIYANYEIMLMGWNVVTGLHSPADNRNVGVLIKVTVMGHGAIVSSESRYHGLWDGAQRCLWLCETADGEGTGCPVDRQTDGWTA